MLAANRLLEAEPHYRRALTIDERSFGLQHPNVARDLNNLAQVLQDTGRLAAAETLMRRVMAIYEKSLGPEHPNVSISLGNLAELLQAAIGSKPGRSIGARSPSMRKALAPIIPTSLSGSEVQRGCGRDQPASRR